MSKKFLLSLTYLSLCKFFWTRTKNRVIENRVMENRVKRGITVVLVYQAFNFFEFYFAIKFQSNDFFQCTYILRMNSLLY